MAALAPASAVRAPRRVPPALAEAYAFAARLLERAAPLADLLLRLFVASVFFRSGLTKIASWSGTLSLFENVYSVPLLPPHLAAWLGTGVELGMPVLLALGLGTRFAAGVLFVFNIVAVVSYADLSPAGLADHRMWGLMLLVTLTHGAGALSLDRAVARRWPRGG